MHLAGCVNDGKEDKSPTGHVKKHREKVGNYQIQQSLKFKMRGYRNKGFYCLFSQSYDNMLVIFVGKKKDTKSQKAKSGKPAGPVNCENNRDYQPREICYGDVVMGKKKVDSNDNILSQIRRDISHKFILYPSYADLQPVGLSKQLRGVYGRNNLKYVGYTFHRASCLMAGVVV